MTIELRSGDCRDVLPTLPADSVQCVVTSPPYYGLRDYGCAAQIGLEPTPDEYLATMVAVFREVKRVLRPDGTCWVNMGSSYSTGKGSNVADQLNRLLEGGSVFFTNAGSVAVTGHGIGVTPKHERAPDSELSSLFAAQRDSVEQRNQDLSKIADLFAHPGAAGFGVTSCTMLVQTTDTQVLLNESKHVPVIGTRCNPQSEAILGISGIGAAWTCEDDKATFAVHNADEPSVGDGVRWHSTWDTFSTQAIRKGLEDIHLVDDAIALGNRLHTLAGLLRDFRVTKASEKHLTLTGIGGGLTLAISDVRHLWFVLRCGSVVPYHKLLEDASRSANALLPKQDIGMPWRLARALQEDGWILRSPIIWHKPNPMPESVTDRPTSAHEHVFLLTKSSRYFYDADAVREVAVNEKLPGRNMTDTREAYGVQNGGNGGLVALRNKVRDQGHADLSRNLRNVWTIATAPYREAHFAVFPPALAERCIKAGTSERGCCSQCGKLWVRTIDKQAYGDKAGDRAKAAERGYTRNTLGGQKEWDSYVAPTTTGWRAGCDHDAPVSPCVVLDPFAGAGTTLLVADRLQRDAIGIELNTAYTEMAMQRCRDDAPLFVDVPAADPEDARMADLFGDMAA